MCFILQVLFFKKTGNFPLFYRWKGKFPPTYATFLRFYIHKDNVRADATDTVPGNYVVLPPSPQAQQLTGTGDDHGAKLSLRQFDPGITDKPQPPSIPNTNNLLAVQLRKFGHMQPSKNRILVKDMMHPSGICKFQFIELTL